MFEELWIHICGVGDVVGVGGPGRKVWVVEIWVVDGLDGVDQSTQYGTIPP